MVSTGIEIIPTATDTYRVYEKELSWFIYRIDACCESRGATHRTLVNIVYILYVKLLSN